MAVSAVLCAAGMAPGLATAHPGRHHARRPSARYLRHARAALAQYLEQHRSPALVLTTPSATTALSYNWSGYADTSTTIGFFKKVGAKWPQPSVACTPEDQIVSTWVGLDGWSDSTVEQAGTMAWCFEGTATYYSWYEMYPAGTVTVGSSVAPGDAITAEVSRSGTAYTLKLADAAHPANNFTKTASCGANTCIDWSAEWIAERPSFPIGITPLASYGRWKVSSGTVTGSAVGTIKSFKPVQITMIDATDTYNLSTASALNTTGNAFSTKWLNSY